MKRNRYLTSAWDDDSLLAPDRLRRGVARMAFPIALLAGIAWIGGAFDAREVSARGAVLAAATPYAVPVDTGPCRADRVIDEHSVDEECGPVGAGRVRILVSVDGSQNWYGP